MLAGLVFYKAMGLNTPRLSNIPAPPQAQCNPKGHLGEGCNAAGAPAVTSDLRMHRCTHLGHPWGITPVGEASVLQVCPAGPGGSVRSGPPTFKRSLPTLAWLPKYGGRPNSFKYAQSLKSGTLNVFSSVFLSAFLNVFLSVVLSVFLSVFLSGFLICCRFVLFFTMFLDYGKSCFEHTCDLILLSFYPLSCHLICHLTLPLKMSSNLPDLNDCPNLKEFG